MNDPNQPDLLPRILADACGRPELADHPEIDLLETGILDSLALVELLEGIEDYFGVVLEPTRIPRERWQNLSSIRRLVEECIKNP